MTRKSVPPQPLKLTDPKSNSEHFNLTESASPTPSPISPTAKLSTRSPFKFTSKKLSSQAQTTQSERPYKPGAETHHPVPSSPRSQTTFSLTTLSLSSADQEGHERRERPSRSSFFSNYKASRSLSRLQEEAGKKSHISGGNMPKDTEKTGLGSHGSSHKEQFPIDPSLAEFSLELRSDSPPPTSSSNASKKSKQKTFNILSRSHSARDEPSILETSEITVESEKMQSQPEVTVASPIIEQERSYRAMIASNVRQHSSERMASFHRDRSKDRSKEHSCKSVKESSNSKSQIISNLHKEISKNPTSHSTSGGANNFLTNLKSQATKGAGALSKGLFGKGTRGVNIVEKPPEIDDENYELKIINLPLVQQTRLTRISKKLEDSRDKTEFWMPAFPWRAIDYLNYKGSDVEGLYRVPGSGPEIKKWRRRFDQELDINLFEQDDLYDINIIGSMLKAWLRELPDELLPKAAQDRIARECTDSEKVPQLLIDELSNLSPFNYYLLFAITCHLSLLLAHSDKNKMDYRNLCICFQPCMKIDAVCFRYLVCDWRDCWKGCKTEPFYIEQEYMLFDQAQSLGLPLGVGSNTAPESTHEEQDRSISSSESIHSTSANEDQKKSHNHINQKSKQSHNHKCSQNQTLNSPKTHNQKSNHTHNQKSSQNQSQKSIQTYNQKSNQNQHQNSPKINKPNRSQSTTPVQNTGLDKRDENSARSFTLSSPHTSPKLRIVGNKSSSSTSNSAPITAGELQIQSSRKAEELRPLSPIKPLSPMGF